MKDQAGIVLGAGKGLGRTDESMDSLSTEQRQMLFCAYLIESSNQHDYGLKDNFNQHLPNSTFAARTALLYGDILAHLRVF
jgi:hypothetical protein